MAWVRTGGGNANIPIASPAALMTATNSVSCAVGDLICLAVTYDIVGGVTPSVDDPAGKVTTFSQPSSAVASDGTNNQAIRLYWGIVTTAGIPTPRVRWNPTPGTSTTDAATLNCDSFTGSDSASTNDSNGAGQLQAGPGTGSNAVTSGNLTTTTNGDLIYAATVDSTTGAVPGTIGTGFTQAQSTTGALVVSLLTEYLEQGTAGAVAGTFTATTGTDSFITAAMAIKPAAITFGGDIDPGPNLTTPFVPPIVSLYG